MLTRCSFDRILMARVFVRLLVETVKLGAVSLLIGWIFQIQPDRDVSAFVLLLSILLFLVGVAGMGCIIGGVSLLYKKANAPGKCGKLFYPFLYRSRCAFAGYPAGFLFSCPCIAFLLVRGIHPKSRIRPGILGIIQPVLFLVPFWAWFVPGDYPPHA